MARLARGKSLDPLQVQVVHATHRCVRRAFLCGQDPLTGRNLEHRRLWIKKRLELLASVFAIDCLTYTVMHNHFHIVLRNRPDIVRSWSDEQVAQRWLRLFPKRRNAHGEPAEPTQEELNEIVLNPTKLSETRVRLSDISWWMRCIAEFIARRANREDKVTGHFWEGRFDSQLLLDEAAILACAMYVDLNPVRAAIADCPENSMYTGAFDRIQDIASTPSKNKTPKHKSRNPLSTSEPKKQTNKRWERSDQRTLSGWLSPIEIDERQDPIGPDGSDCGRRASLKGFLNLSLTRYLELLDWTGKQIKAGKRGSIPRHLKPILQRIGIQPDNFRKVVSKFGRLFKRVAGNPQSVANEASRRGQNFLQAPGATWLSAS